MILGDLTWTEVRDLSRDLIIVFPCGALEQHGPHLPLLTDTIIVAALSERLERARPDLVLLTPTFWAGASEDHLAFPGSIDGGLGEFGDHLRACAGSLARHGFRRFLMLNSHGGNSEALQVANRRLKQDHPHAVFACANYWQVAETEINAILETQRGLGHACELETSLLLTLRPDLVRTERAAPDGIPLPQELRGVRVARTFDERTREGVFGDPTAATAEKGVRLLEAIHLRLLEVVDALVALSTS